MPFPSPEAVVRSEVRDGIALITVDHPPVNAIGQPMRAGLIAAMQAVRQDSAVRAVVLIGAGAHFIAGADIREFAAPPRQPWLPEVCAAIEGLDVPVVAVLQGAALGGGLEIALACHYRVALPGARLGLPEVTLGLLPGAGGTQRLPRLVGVPASLDLILGGQPVDATEAYSLGLVDQVASGSDPRDEGLRFARDLIAAGKGVRRTRDRAVADVDAAPLAVECARVRTAQRSRGLLSPFKAIDAVEASFTLPFEDGLKFERGQFLQCLDSPQRAGLVHAFFAEREVLKTPEAGKGAVKSLSTVGVVGGGTMGTGIALALLEADLPVVMVEQDGAALERARLRLHALYEGMVAKGRLSRERAHSRLSRWQGSTALDDLATMDLVIEAVFEDMDVKRAVFARLDRVCRADAILATNTSYLDIDALAESVSRPGSVIGLHFFSPAHVMKLLEIVVPARAHADTVATAFELARCLRKVPVRAGVCDGFIGNRMLAVYREAADHMVADGASPYQIDRALRDFGFPMGPYQVIDLAGGDIGWAARKRRAGHRVPGSRYVAVGDRLCERGWFGQKSGRGYYRYSEGSRTGEVDPDVEAIIDAERTRMGITPRSFDDEEIVRRYLAAMVNAGANVLHEGIALRPLDVDIALIHGYAFPRHRGGPMHHADRVGLDAIVADLRAFGRDDPFFWTPSPLLLQLHSDGASFASLNRPEWI